MNLFKIGGTQIKCSPWLLAVIPMTAALGGIKLIVVAFLSLSVHEAAHAMMAYRLGYSAISVSIQPFGFTARLDMGSAVNSDMAAIYLAGPVSSICMAALSALFEKLVPAFSQAGMGMTEYNLIIAAVNLLPALPLDGGRLVCCLLNRRAPRLALKITRALGVLTGAGFLAVFAQLLYYGAINITFPVMGVFLIFAALEEKPHPAPIRSTRRAFNRRSMLEVNQVAITENTPISKAFLMLPPGGYALVSVVDGHMRRVGVLDESRLYDAAGALGASATLKDAVALQRGRML